MAEPIAFLQLLPFMKEKLIAFFKNKQNIVILVSLVVFAALLAVDLSTKAWAANTDIHQSEYFLGIVRFNFTKNYGMAWSMFDDNETAMNIVTAFTVLLIIGLGVLYFTVFKKNTPARIVLAVIEAGAIGNLIDRLALGYVRDMVDVSPVGFGVCNFADFFITFGGVIFLFIIVFIGKDALFPLKKEWREQAKKEEEAKRAVKDAEAAASSGEIVSQPEEPPAEHDDEPPAENGGDGSEQDE